ncbi:hypothetical protein PIB30_020045 [Stylosanthes scabra]|uniref:Treslin n=1 Tax=Stylosanthes scabra TaxID=79078 RepID=A0ABU6TAJ3_9FABA|nr:hypothetical protein [Stylosanthes scabra]
MGFPEADPDPVTRYSHTERIVLLIDLDPLLHLPDPTPYTSAVLSSAATLLSFNSLSTALFSFRLFLSSLSPILSSSTLSLPLSLSFDLPSPTLRHLTQTLSSLPSLLRRHHTSSPKASHIASTLRQLIHDYAWDPDSSSDSPVPSNLVLLFSPLCNSFEQLLLFFDGEVADECSFCQWFSGFFGSVRDVFSSRDIHCSWVSVTANARFESECGDSGEIGRVRGFFESGVKGLGWGFCDADSIVLGSALVPFGLIYPKIGVYWGSLDFNDCSPRKPQVQLSLQILDVNKSPIQYNCCDLELVDLKIRRRCGDARFNPDLANSQGAVCQRNERFWKQFSDGIMKFEVKAVQKCDAFVNVRECLSESVLVREVFKESKKNKDGNSDDFFADRVLEMLATEFGFQRRRKSVPIWEILLSFLCKEGCWALVSLSNGNGGSCMCVLRPFTVYSALLSVLGGPDVANDSGGTSVAQYIRTMEHRVFKSDRKSKKDKVFLDSQAKKSDAANEGPEEKKRMDFKSLQNLTWSSFCESVYNQFEMDLQDVYSVIESSKSKKLKFLKWWMKQIKKSSRCDIINLSEKPKSNEIIAEKSKGKLTKAPQDIEDPVSSSASAGINTETSRIQDDAVLDCRLETSADFFSNLSTKIQQGIESEVIDLGAMAKRLVNSSIYCLCRKDSRETKSEGQEGRRETNSEGQKGGRETNSEGQKCVRETNSEGQHDDREISDEGHNAPSSSIVASELIKFLLREPKELAAKYKSRNSFSQASEPGCTTQVKEHAAREYELQILLRMEILQSEVGSGIEDSSKHKFVKQICQLLDDMHCHMEGGYFGDWNLENYVAKIIKSRYSHTLEDVVHKIYNKMELLLFADEEEAPNNLLNSEDSNKPLNQAIYRDEMGENDISNEPMSSENEPFQFQNNDTRNFQRVIQEDHNRKLIEAKERRDRARRFSSFTSWMPDLQRVWAPKHKGMKPKTDPFRKEPQKERKRASYDRVCETPLTGNKRSIQRARGSGYDNYIDDWDQASGSVSRKLFQGD